MNRLSAAGLTGLSATIEVPFLLTLQEGGWLVLEVLRFLPGRRLVVRARRKEGTDGQDAVKEGADGRDAVLKLFFGRGHRRYLRRERRGLDRLAHAGLGVPALKAVIAESGLSGLILEYLPGARPVVAADRAALETIAGYFGRLHGAGFLQSDPHLANFVISRDGVYAIDGDGVRRWRGAFREARERTNLAFLAAQRGPEEDAGLPGMLAAYSRERGRPAPPLQAFRKELGRARRMRMRAYLKKTLRECSEFTVHHEFRRHTCARRGAGERVMEAVLAALADRDRIEADATGFLSGDVLKAGNSATVIRIAAPDPVVIKRYNVKNARHALRRMLRRLPRYRRAWMYGQLLGFLDLPVARPLALMEERRGCWRGAAYLIQEDLEGPDLATEVAEAGLSDARIEEVVALFRRLQAFGLSHGDTKATNFLIHHGRVHLIDLDATRLGGRGAARDVSRFLENWGGGERARFEAAFRQAGLLSLPQSR